MKTLAYITAVALLVMVSVFAVVQTAPTNVSAQDATVDNEDEDTAVVYEYITQSGDSYTLMARKAVQTYGLKHDVNLSLAQIIYAETNLALAAGSPSLITGQEVSISEADIETWVNNARDMTEAQESAWNFYVRFVSSFNTDRVGEAR